MRPSNRRPQNQFIDYHGIKMNVYTEKHLIDPLLAAAREGALVRVFHGIPTHPGRAQLVAPEQGFGRLIATEIGHLFLQYGSKLTPLYEESIVRIVQVHGGELGTLIWTHPVFANMAAYTRNNRHSGRWDVSAYDSPCGWHYKTEEEADYVRDYLNGLHYDYPF